MKQLLLSLLLVGAVCISAVAQRTITGTIVDPETGEALPGASIQIKGTTTGTVTDLDGKYSLSASPDDVLIVSFIGFESQEVAVGNRTVIDVQLSIDSEQLSEVVVIGYGETSIKDATGAVAAVNADDFNTGVIASPEQLIQGIMAGVQVTQNSGDPGSGIALRIRGTNSVRSNNNPLFVVDGVPLSGDATSASGNVGVGTSTQRNPLNFLNPSDIESISVLKDASASAIYGSRGANGVVFITTKKGSGSGTLEYGGSVSVASPANEYDLLNASEFVDAVSSYGGVPENAGSDTDWQDVVTRTAISTSHNLAYSQGLANGSIRGSFGYDNQNGVVEKSSMERIAGRFNVGQSFMNEALNVNLSATISRVNDENAPLSGSAGFRGDLLGSAYSANPTWPDDPTFVTGGQTNPSNLLENFQSTGFTNRQLINLSVDYELTDGLVAKVTYGLDNSSSETVSLLTPDVINVDRGAAGNGRGGLNTVDVTNNLFEATLNWTKEFSSSKLEVLAGYSYQDFGRKGANVEGWGFSSSDFTTMENAFISEYETLDARAAEANAANGGDFYQQFGRADNSGFFVNILPVATITDAGVSAGDVQSIFADRFDFTDALQSYFGRLNYTINNKYILTATVRADGSSRFGPDNQYGVFPSGAFAWKLDEEDFVGSAFSTLKLRAGYGVTGNQDGLGYGNFLIRTRYATEGIQDNGNINIPGTERVALNNSSLQWEETTQLAVGIDFGLNNERLRGSIDYYNKQTTDLILRLNAAQPSPNDFVFDNFDATVVNKGVEVTLSYDFVQTSDVTFTGSFNYARNDNEIQDFAGLIPAGTIRGQGLTGAYAQALAGGVPLFSYYLREFEGFDSSGQPIQGPQQFIDKGALPTDNGGLTLSLNYKNLDVSTYFAGQFGHYVYNNTQNAFFTAGAIQNGRNVTRDVLTNGESGTAAADVSTRFLEKGDFVRLQTFSVGYNIPVSGAISSLRVYLNAQNLFLITDYTGLDPEVSVQPGQDDLLNQLPTAGVDYTAYPRPRTFTLGVNARF